MDLVAIASQAWKLTLRHKALWLFGVFVAVSGGVGGGGGGGGGDAGSRGDPGPPPPWIWPLLAAGLLLALGALWMHVVSEGALIDAVRRAREGEAPREGWRAGRAAFGRVLWVKVGTLGAGGGLVLLLAAPALLAWAGVLPVLVALALGLVVGAVVLPLLLTVYLVNAWALRFAVLDGLPARQALRAGWDFLHGRILESLKVLLLAFLGQVGGSAAAALAALPGGALFLALWLLSGRLIPAAVAGGLLALPLVLAAAGAAGTFRSTVWTLGFLESRAASRA